MNRATFFIFNDSTPVPEETVESDLLDHVEQFAQLDLPLLNVAEQVEAIQPSLDQPNVLDESESTHSNHLEPTVEPITTELPVVTEDMNDGDLSNIESWLTSRDISMKRGDILVLNYIAKRRVFVHDGDGIIYLPRQAIPESMEVVKEFPIRYWAYGDGCYPPIHEVAFDFECFSDEIIANLMFIDGKVRSTFHHNEQAYTAIFECIMTSAEEWDDHRGKLIEFLSNTENINRLMFNHCEYEGSELEEDYVHDEFRLHIFPPDEDWEVIPSGYA